MRSYFTAAEASIQAGCTRRQFERTAIYKLGLGEWSSDRLVWFDEDDIDAVIEYRALPHIDKIKIGKNDKRKNTRISKIRARH